MTENYLDSCLVLRDWRTPATGYPERQLGNYRIKRIYYRGHYYMYGIDGYLFFEAPKRIPVTQLQELRGKRWHSWMVDDPPHERAMEIYAEQSRGRVLIAGLGLGLILHALAKNDRVTSVTCIEISQEVIGLVGPEVWKYRPKIQVIREDFYKFIREDNTKWDGIITDLWVAGPENKMDIFYHEVLPFAVALRVKYPDTPLTFHGFSTVSDIKHTTLEMTEKVCEMMSFLRRGGER